MYVCTLCDKVALLPVIVSLDRRFAKGKCFYCKRKRVTFILEEYKAHNDVNPKGS